MLHSHNVHRVAASFHRQAAAYDHTILVQNRIIDKLARELENSLQFKPARALDIGCGTGTLLACLQSSFPAACLVGLDIAPNMCLHTMNKLPRVSGVVNANAERLPFTGASFDLVVSSSVFQWVDDLTACFSECTRVLRPGGMLRIALFADGTLAELQECYREAVHALHGENSQRLTRLHSFRSQPVLESLLAGIDGLDVVSVTAETEVDWYDSVKALLRSIKDIGAGSSTGSPAGGLAWRRVIDEMTDRYVARYAVSGKIPASYRIVHVVAKRSIH